MYIVNIDLLFPRSSAEITRQNSVPVSCAFTEHGALMAANILKSKTAVSISIYVVRAFIRMREELTSRRDLKERLDQIDKILLVHDTQLKELFEKIRQLLLPPPEKPRKKIYPVKPISPASAMLHYDDRAATLETPHIGMPFNWGGL